MNFFWSYQQIQQLYTAIKYGYLYNWYAATDSRNIAADGWHVPSNAEFETLATFLGGRSVAGGKMKEIGFTYFQTPNIGADNSSGFNGRGNGYRYRISSTNYGFLDLVRHGGIWTTTSIDGTLAYQNYMWFNDATLTLSAYYKKGGFAIRPVKDSTILTNGQTGTYTGNDGKIYRTICIGTQEWVAYNIAETKYRNGDTIPVVTDNLAWASLTTGARCVFNNDESNM